MGGISDKSIPSAEPDNENVNRSIVLLGLRLSSGVDVFRIYHADWPYFDPKIIWSAVSFGHGFYFALADGPPDC